MHTVVSRGCTRATCEQPSTSKLNADKYITFNVGTKCRYILQNELPTHANTVTSTEGYVLNEYKNGEVMWEH